MACSHIKSCELFVQFALNPALEIWKQHYCNGEYEECVRFKLAKMGQPVPLTLLPNGKNIELNQQQDEFGTTALFNCIVKNRVRMARSIINTTSINIDASNIEGTTALMAAVEVGSEEMLHLILEYHANTHLKNMHGQTAYDIAVEKNHKHLVELLARHR